MSIENPYSQSFGWKIDPDGRQDRSPGPVTTRMMTDEEKLKYGIAERVEVEDMKEKLDVDVNRMIEICRVHGTGIDGIKEVAKEFHLTDKQASNQIYNRGIKMLLQEEATAKVQEVVQEEQIQSDINGEQSKYWNELIAEPLPELATEAAKQVSEKARESIKTLSAEVDEMMELVPDNINHPKHYNTGSIEVIDYLQDKLPTDMFEGFCVGNALKYLSRYRFKGGIEDLKKAQWYLSRIIGVMESAS